MAYSQYARWLQFGLVFVISYGTTAVHALSPDDGVLIAQIIPDDTLGNESSIVINDNNIDRVDGGAIRGANLFHSFQDFNIGNGQQVYFSNPENIETILSRITGLNSSDIDGLLGVDGTANLFLLNPNGITFGPNAELDIQGAFTASTAGALEFTDGSLFSADNPQGASLLTMSVPLGVQFSDVPQEDITNQGNLAVGPGQTLTLFGDTVLSSGHLTAVGGEIQVLGNSVGLIDQATVDVASIAGGGSVLLGGDYQGQGMVPTAEQTFVGLDVIITADALEGGNGGQVIVWADGNTQFYGSITAKGGITEGNGGFVEVSGAEFLTFQGTVDTTAPLGETGMLLLDPTNITIVDDPVTVNIPSGLQDDGIWSISEDPGDQTLTSGTIGSLLSNGNLTLQASETISVNGEVNSNSSNDLALEAPIIQVNDGLAQQGGGDIIVETQDLTIAGFGKFDTSTGGSSDSGQINITAENIRVEALLGITSQVNPGANGESGGIVIITNNLELVEGGSISASTTSGGTGTAGLIAVMATGDVLVSGNGSGIFSQVQNGAVGNSRGITLATQNLTVENGGKIDASIGGIGNAGSIVVTATGNIRLENNINPLSVIDGGSISASTVNGGIGDAGLITIAATNDVLVSGNGSGILSQVENGAEGNSSGIVIANANNLTVTGGGKIDSSTGGAGNAGPIMITANDNIRVENEGSSIASQVNVDGDGRSEGIILQTNDLLVLDQGQISASTASDATAITPTNDAGQVQITADGNITVSGNGSGILSLVKDRAEGRSEGIVITNANNLSVTEGGKIDASTGGIGNAGPVMITVTDTITVDGDGSFIASQVNIDGDGNSEGLVINTGNLFVQNIGRVSTSTASDKTTITPSNDSGQLTITATGNIIVDGEDSAIVSEVSSGAIGDSGGMIINTNNLLVQNLGSVSTSTANGGKGNSGSIEITATGETRVNGRVERIDANGRFEGISSRIGSQAEEGAIGNSGNLTITTRNLIAENGGKVDTSTGGTGDSGLLSIIASDIMVDGEASSIASQVNKPMSEEEEGGLGNSSGINIATDTLSVSNDGQISASTSNEGTAGDVRLQSNNSSDLRITLSSNGLIEAKTSSGAAGGNLILTVPDTLTVQGAGDLTVESTGATTGPAGDLDVAADIVILKDAVELSAQTASEEGGGNINFLVDGAIVMRRGSFINAESTNTTPNAGDGGNITISTDFLVAPLLENNDIIANAVSGNGGRIEVTALSILNFSDPEGLTTAELRARPTNDLSASSQFGDPGEVILNNLNLDPSQGLTELPSNLNDPSDQIAQGCNIGGNATADSSTAGNFEITGRGGQPIGPTGIPGYDAPLDDLGPTITQPESSTPLPESLLPEKPQFDTLADAQDAIMTELGEVFLIAESSWQPSLSCASLHQPS
ncbi:two-partner secretion domain-containing protein [Leptothoe spongobia]|uniref:Filamentous hemagglutinin N-terminal domain-containing protein n=1 Tax=Leptothoe spongobia TAU-MAC 1115 TaxID=1967444 RepID=A0A947DDE7_9CYAN|nr:filamentous hemagglutinin N-terminal domain-containing protein [Leptothoe spongobia]MBT9314835.1 filamentous hemagglutinin N-terminal domain-containing protein [Leptothoe spongobia TAU-MAC 1115]